MNETMLHSRFAEMVEMKIITYVLPFELLRVTSFFFLSSSKGVGITGVLRVTETMDLNPFLFCIFVPLVFSLVRFLGC